MVCWKDISISSLSRAICTINRRLVSIYSWISYKKHTGSQTNMVNSNLGVYFLIL